MKMNKYKIIVEEVGTAVVEIEAEDEFVAEDIAMEKWGEGEYDGLMIRDISIIVEQ
jgi:hypothetical protein